MRLLAALTVAALSFAVPAQAGDPDSSLRQPVADPAARLIDDPIGLLLEDPIELLLRSYSARQPAPAPRRREIALEVAALDSELMAVSTGAPVTAPARRPLRNAPPGSADLAARAFDPNYAKGWPAAVGAPTPNVEAPPKIVLDGNILLRVDYNQGR